MKVEMAALVAGVQYGLSQGHFNENKSLIFVKLTDSAYRAIEEYSRNKNKCNENPTIQFLENGNEGRLLFPSLSQPTQQRGGRVGFNFSLSSNADIEGPQGSFECIKQNGPKCLETVGSLHCKMRIHANEDIYEATRSRMAAVEQQQKKNCTREIELNKTTGIGRKVKLSRNSATKIDPIPPSSYGYPSIKYQNSSIKSSPINSIPVQKHGNPDIIRQPLRTRLIHLLAVRNYKKPELYAAITRDGMKERDKNQLMPTLQTIASVRDNTYRLLRHVWNEVREDWPFYSEQERQMLKRNKPQNLTPPGNSDGGSSASSGQSPSSNHPGSPPSAIEGPSSLKRPGYFNGVDGIQTKRHRVSHYRKPGATVSTSSSSTSNQQSEETRLNSVKSKMDSFSSESGYSNKKVKPDNMELFNSNNNERSPNLPFNTMTSYAKADTDSDNDDYNLFTSSNKQLSNNRSLNFSPQLSPVSNSNTNNRPPHFSPSTASINHSSSNGPEMSRDGALRHANSDLGKRKTSKLPKLTPLVNNEKVSADVSSWLNNSSNDVDLVSTEHQNTGSTTTKPFTNISESTTLPSHHMSKNSSQFSSYSIMSPSFDSVPVDSSHSTKENAAVNICNQNDSTNQQFSHSSQPVHPVQPVQPVETPRYIKDYTTIKTLEQRRKYKDDFNANYTEYKSLHKIVEQTTQKFSRLEGELKKHPKNSQEYERIKKDIVTSYRNVKNNKNYQATKKKFQYLHDKLSHIKKLVSDFDSIHLKSNGSVVPTPVS